MKLIIEPQSFQIGLRPQNLTPLVSLNFYHYTVKGLIDRLFKPYARDVTVRVGIGLLDDEMSSIEALPDEEDEETMELAVYCHVQAEDEVPELASTAIPIHHRDSEMTEYLVGGITDLDASILIPFIQQVRDYGSFTVFCGYHQRTGQRFTVNTGWYATLTTLEDSASVYHDVYSHFRLEERATSARRLSPRLGYER